MRVLVAFCLLFGMMWAPVANAQDEATEVERTGSVGLILDSSGSMAENDAGGEARIEAARSALGTLISELPEGAPVGLRVYGDAQTPAEKRVSCDETFPVQPVAPLDSDQLRGTLDDFDPGGKTPIGLALKDTAEELPDDGEQAIVLVSDGIDTCAPPDPCKVAAGLARKGVSLRIQAVGLNADPEAERELRCIAEVTGGIYRDAGDAESLADSLRAATLRALRSYNVEGEPVTGGETGPEAAPVTEGQYVDVIRPDSIRWYSIDLPAGTGLVTSGTVVPPTPRIDIGVASTPAALTGSMFRATTDGEDEELDSQVEVGVTRELGSGKPISVTNTSVEPVAEDSRIVFAVQLEDRTDGLPNRNFAFELLVDVVGEPIEEEEPEEPEEPEEASGEEEADEGPGLAVALGVGVGAGLLGLGVGAGALRGRRR